MKKDEVLRWAIEQAVALHAQNGVSAETLLVEAQKIADFVSPPKPEKEAAS